MKKMEFVFQRKLYDRMLQWKQEEQGQTALLIEGVRRVGKSTLAETFAKKEYRSYILIDFNKASKETKGLFDDLSSLDFIFLRLQAQYGVQLYERQSVIVFDEVQKCPNARQAIKYLVEDGRYDYIETGSLISIRKNTKDITIPSEEERVQLHPLDLEEFRWAVGDKALMPLLQQFYDKRVPLGAAFRNTMRNLRLYMLVGGMPQAVAEYLKTNNLSRVDKKKRDILKLYFEDLNKIDPSGKAAMLFKAIPAQLTGNAKRYQVSSVLKDDRVDTVAGIVGEMQASMCINLSRHVSDPNVGLSLSEELDCYKMFVCDTGLFITLAFWDKSYTENVIYEKLLSDKLSANLGYVYENLVAQMLMAAGNELYYHTWPTPDGKHNYEIDFLLSRGNKLCPLEVKSSGYKTHASLDAFQKRFSARILHRYLVYTKDLAKDQDVLMLPVFMVGLI